MKYRDIRVIKQEIKGILNLMAPLENYLIDNPNDFAVEGNLNRLRGRYVELLRELDYTKKIESDFENDFYEYIEEFNGDDEL